MQEENLPKDTPKPKNEIIGNRNWLNRLFTGQSGERLDAVIDIYWLEMSNLERMLKEANLEPSQYGFNTLFELLKKSTLALKKYDLAKGWNAFNAAQRIETQIYHRLIQHRNFKDYAKGKLQAKATSVYSEGNKKLRGWRKQTVNSLLSKDNQPKPTIELSDLIQSEQILSEHHSNVYRRLNIVQNQFLWLAIIAVIAIVGWIILLIFRDQLIQSKTQVYDLALNIQTIIFGVLGACISGILTLANSSTRQNIPEKLLNSWVTFARPLVGIVSALAVVIFTLNGILEIGEESSGLYLAAAFIAGFSERLLIKTIEGVLGKVDEAEKKGENGN